VFSIIRQSIILIGILCLTFWSVQSQSEHPNIIVILTDDQGWDGTSVQMDNAVPNSRSDYYLTPRLEQLAQEGMKFSRAYAASPVCSPSRYAILTGQSPARLDMTDITDRNPEPDMPIISPSSVDEIDLSLDFLPQELKAIVGANYRCASFGKWHLGLHGPGEVGFDEYTGNYGNGFGNVGDFINEDPKRIFSITEDGMDFMESSVAADRPFFMQLNHFAVHLWPQAFLETFEKYQGIPQGDVHFYRAYAAMTEDLDTGVGMIMDKLVELGIENDTYIFYTSDNGCVEWETLSFDPDAEIPTTLISPSLELKAGKTHVWEGGIRVPFIVKGPNVPANTQSEQLVVGTDLFATILDLANPGSGNSTLDSKNLLANITDPNHLEDRELVFHFPHYAIKKGGIPRAAIFQNDEKLVHDFATGDSYLFDIEENIGEETPGISNENRKLELTKSLRDYLWQANASLPTLNPSYFAATDPANVDNDLLPDDWEFLQLLSTKYNENDDPDGDGYTNLEEFNGNGDPLKFETALSISDVNHVSEFADFMPLANGMRVIFKRKVDSYILSDVTGRTVFQEKSPKQLVHDFDLTATKQVYLLRFEINDRNYSHKFIH